MNLFLLIIFAHSPGKNASEINDYYNEDYVTQHDLLRELAMFESCQGPEGQRQRWIIDASENTQDQQPINARLLSISTGLFMFSVITHMHGKTKGVNTVPEAVPVWPVVRYISGTG